MLLELILLLALIVAVGAWLDTLRQHDHALRAARHLCTNHQVQLLDHTVGLSALKLRRQDGRLTLERHYSFEVSVSGNDRQPGSLWLLHGRLAGVSAAWLKPPDAHSLDARSAVTHLLERISHDRTT
ncbi:DUF3301 domain-containing protein [Dyella sp.]|uniref:DUF3301 domain-containing protein n=1 Tax=Dyella sp. TaxID=1869338 RepID=UPI002D778565|nr:DUF3301 domain-containing protein [Dyella sp.]HET7330527.1 DUF3301 domain-containing protein [Dyella sp.]